MGGVQIREFGQDQIVFSLAGDFIKLRYCKLMKAEPEYDTCIYFFIVRLARESLPQYGSPAPPVPASRSGVVA
jgi:hypothetical protein